jgi:hypothetical protein
MMSGSTLFGQHSFATLAYKIAHETPAPATSRNAALPAAVDGVLAKALSREPAQRFASCGQFVEALEVAFAENIPVDEEVTRIAPVVKESERRWYAAKGLATRAASLARSSIAVGPFVLGLVKAKCDDFRIAWVMAPNTPRDPGRRYSWRRCADPVETMVDWQVGAKARNAGV